MVYSNVPALAQACDSPALSDHMIRRYCEAERVSTGAEVELVTAVAPRRGFGNPRITIAVLNAWVVEVSTDSSLICVPAGLVHFMRSHEGELAFILGHEIGHATDDRCKRLSGSAKVADQSGPAMAQETEQGTSGPVKAELMSCGPVKAELMSWISI
jgi:hypothetical protein